MLPRGDNLVYDREIRKLLQSSGFHIVNDLMPLYHMSGYFNKVAGLSKQARLRLNEKKAYQIL